MDWSNAAFIAHASEDKPAVRNLYRKLKDAGLDPWFDEESIGIGEDWDAKIKEAIKKSRFFLACLSSVSVAKDGYIQREWRRGLDQAETKTPGTVYFIPLLLDDNVRLPEIEVGTVSLRKYQGVNISTERGMERLIAALRKHAGDPAAPEVKSKDKLLDDFLELAEDGALEKSLDGLRQYARESGSRYRSTISVMRNELRQIKDNKVRNQYTDKEYSMAIGGLSYRVLELIGMMKDE